MKRVSILGCGRLGSTIGRALTEGGYSVKGSTTIPERFGAIEQAGIQPVQLAMAPGPEGDAASLFDTDVLVVTLTPPQTKTSCEAGFSYLEQLECIGNMAVEFNIQQVIFTGATFIYPLSDSEVTEEDVNPEISSFMGLDWLKVEQAITSSAPDKTTVLRLAGLMGEGHSAAAYFSGRPMGGADNPVNMVYQVDVANIIKMLIEKEICGETFNVCAPEHPARRQFYSLSSEKAGIAPPVFTDEVRPYRIVNCDKLTRKLSYTFQYPDPLQALASL